MVIFESQGNLEASGLVPFLQLFNKRSALNAQQLSSFVFDAFCFLQGLIQEPGFDLLYEFLEACALGVQILEPGPGKGFRIKCIRLHLLRGRIRIHLARIFLGRS